MYNVKQLAELTHPGFWDERYRSKQQELAKLTAAVRGEGLVNEADAAVPLDAYEWFRSVEQIRPFLERHLPGGEGYGEEGSRMREECRILHLGCGNSTLTADLHALGYSDQISVDFSQVVIDSMQVKYASLNSTWQVMDLRDLNIEDASIDIAIDKATPDAMMHGSLWDPPADVRENVGKYAEDVARVLKPGAKWLYVPFRQPHFIKILLDRSELWHLDVEVLADPQGTGGFDYFGCVMTKHS
ncbi:hypothetical protein PVAG01_11147 [Phlyctema vagabunda]|uniref:Methyltransferase domain-containing protein n=1 Tax=Phlyctema vagabunda TaxID=108571 RepID=A0ABR4P1H4_9HELO